MKKHIGGGRLRRELIMLWIRKNVKYGGMPVNRRGFHNTNDPDIKALFKRGLIKQVREDRSWAGNNRSTTKLTRLLPVDGISLDGPVTCPDCGLTVDDGGRPGIGVGHARNCSLRTNHDRDSDSAFRRSEVTRLRRSISKRKLQK